MAKRKTLYSVHPGVLTHRIPITARAEIDDEVKHWLQVAYELDTREFRF